MDRSKYTYRINWIIAAILLVEIVFWSIAFVVQKKVDFSSGGAVDHILFKSPKVLYWLGLIGVFILVLLYKIWKHNKYVGTLSERIASTFLKPVSNSKTIIRFFLLRNAFVFLVIALAQPIYGKKKVSGTSESLELVVCLDISNSMNTMDISKDISRLGVAKRALIQLVNNLHGEKVGLCLFANNAFVHLPLTRDYPAAKLFIQDIETNLIQSQGTNVAEAISISREMFTKDKTTKAIVLITDGENHEEDPTEVLASLKKDQIQFSVLGIGTTKGGPVPKNPYRPELGYKTNAVGMTVVSKLDKRFLDKIAAKGGGQAFVSSDEFPNLSALLTEIKAMKRTKIDNFDFEIKQERYQIPLSISLLFWVMFLIYSRLERKTRIA